MYNSINATVNIPYLKSKPTYIKALLHKTLKFPCTPNSVFCVLHKLNSCSALIWTKSFFISIADSIRASIHFHFKITSGWEKITILISHFNLGQIYGLWKGWSNVIDYCWQVYYLWTATSLLLFALFHTTEKLKRSRKV